MKKFVGSRTPGQDRLARQDAKAERLERVAKNPRMPWLMGRAAAYGAWQERPRSWERKVAVRTDALIGRLDDSTQAARQRSEAQLQETIAQYHHLKVEEPEFVPTSTEVTPVPLSNEQPTQNLAVPARDQ